ncbi:MAG: hypothetical protein QF917_00220 [Candidatus Woesearchaeota archaeon]|jgi:hypothetical protein|nr:hypothetical protein [Candidatus Woesearchaeota archaeon]|tara:strand:- start:8257 stop:8511 length:255 start_codon:yes stop_codon:yes gene_type:complete
MIKIPKLKKKISSFLTKEEGKISKEKLIKAGILLGAAALVSVNEVEATFTPHKNVLTLDYAKPSAIGAHSHAPSHSSHSSHSSY